MGKLGELKELLDAITKRVDSMCKDVCDSHNLDYSEEFGDSDDSTVDDVEKTDKHQPKDDSKDVGDDSSDSSTDDQVSSGDDSTKGDKNADKKGGDIEDKDDDSDNDSDKESDNDSDNKSDIESDTVEIKIKPTDMEVIDINNESTIYSLYDLSKVIFESLNGSNEDGGDYGFDDYVDESKLDKCYKSITESSVTENFYGCDIITESDDYFKLRDLEAQLERLTGRKVSGMGDLDEYVTDTPQIKSLKRRIRAALGERDDTGGYAATLKQNKKEGDLHTDINGNKTSSYLFHNGLKQMGAGINREVEAYLPFLPTGAIEKMNIPSKLAGLGAATLGGLAFGPLGIIGGYLAKKGIEKLHDKWNDRNMNSIKG